MKAQAAIFPTDVFSRRSVSASSALFRTVALGASLFGAALFLLTLLSTPAVAKLYPIGPHDDIEIQVAELPEINLRQAVSEHGTVTMPVLGDIDVAGYTEPELILRMRALLEEQGLRKATVRVYIHEFVSQRVFIYGAVAKPGRYSVKRQFFLRDVLSLAQGVTKFHNGYILIRRKHEDLLDEIRIEIADLITYGDPKVNIPIFADDEIHVPPARSLEICMTGAVNTGCFTYPDREPLLLVETLLRLGGLKTAAAKKIQIRRLNRDGTRQEILVDYKAILKGKIADFELQDKDLIFVKEAFF